MKKWLVGILLLGAVIAMILLTEKGILSLTWQKISILLAALAGPFKFVSGLFGNKEEEIRKKHEAITLREAEYHRGLESAMRERELRISDLSKDIEILDAKLDALKSRRESVDAEVERMSLQELRAAGQEYFGK